MYIHVIIWELASCESIYGYPEFWDNVIVSATVIVRSLRSIYLLARARARVSERFMKKVLHSL